MPAPCAASTTNKAFFECAILLILDKLGLKPLLKRTAAIATTRVWLSISFSIASGSRLLSLFNFANLIATPLLSKFSQGKELFQCSFSGIIILSPFLKSMPCEIIPKPTPVLVVSAYSSEEPPNKLAKGMRISSRLNPFLPSKFASDFRYASNLL